MCTFHREQTRMYSFENPLFYGLNQFRNKARTDNTADDHGSRKQDKYLLISDVSIFIYRNQQNGVLHQAPEA